MSTMREQRPAALDVGIYAPTSAPLPTTDGRRLERLLLATDGNTAADAAVAFADALSRARAVDVHVVAVVEPMPTTLPLGEAGLLVLPHERVAREQRGRVTMQVQEQLLELAAGGSGFDVEVLAGSIAPTIIQAAREHRADLIVTGIGRHRMVDRLFRTETALNVMRMADVPVLAAAAELRALPRHALVGMDFGASSVHAARVALQLLAPDGTLTLAHVQPAVELPEEERRSWRAVYAQGMASAFARLLAELPVPPSVRVETVALDGNPAIELLDLAQRTHADLIATGRHSHTFFERFVIGSVATRLLRSAACSVLVAPAVRPSGLGIRVPATAH